MLQRVKGARLSRPAALLLVLGVIAATMSIIPVAAGQEVPSLIIVKQASPADGTEFPFSGDCPTGAVQPFSLASGQSTELGCNKGFYHVGEGMPGAGWALDHVVCEGADGYAVSNGVLTVEVNRPNVTCTFYNLGYGKIIVKKVTSPAEAPVASFGFHRSFGADFFLAGGASAMFPVLVGTHSVSEAMPLGEGWSLTSASCDDGSQPGAIGVSVGEVVTCTFDNTHEETTTTTTTTTTTVPPSTTTTTEAEGPELPNTGGQPWTLTLLLGGLAAVLMGLSLRVWSLMRQTDKL